jgi:hypothetical protein
VDCDLGGNRLSVRHGGGRRLTVATIITVAATATASPTAATTTIFPFAVA